MLARHAPLLSVVEGSGPAMPAANLKAVSGTSKDVGEALRAYACKELLHAMTCLSWRQARLHQGVHQTRKSLRRVRATLALTNGVLGRGAVLIDRELRRINRSLSDLRDGQALVEAADRLVKADSSSGHGALVRSARQAAIRRRAELGRIATSGSVNLSEHRNLIAVILGGLPALPWSAVDEPGVLRALEESGSRERCAGLQATKSGRDADWHRWRRRIRRLSQQHRALYDLCGLPQDIRDQDKAVAVLMGEVQDFSLLAEHCGARSPFPAADRRPLRALADHEARRLRAHVAELASQRQPLVLPQ